MRTSAPTRISVVGLGYVGLATAACFAGGGFRVHGVDNDGKKISAIANGKSPIHEWGLNPLVKKTVKRKAFTVSTSYEGIAQSNVIFIAVGTPSKEDGGMNSEFLEAASREVGQQLSKSRGYRLVVVKSTVAPGTTEGIVRPILERASGKKVGRDIGLASNPEFLHEGSAIYETLHPEAIVVGGHDKKSSSTLVKLYDSFYKKHQMTIVTTPANAEMMKYAINGGRAVQLSFVNTVADLCTRIPGCDYDEVRKGLSQVAKMDQRYLSAGMGFGGSCVPPYTRVVTEHGFSPISDIEVGDKVLSHDGLYHCVTKTYTRDYDGMMHLFKSSGFSATPLLVTPDHPIFACLRNTGSGSKFYKTVVPNRGLIQKMQSRYLIEAPSFTDPTTLSQGDFMVLPALREESPEIPILEMSSPRRFHSIPLNPELMYVFGLWLAEGVVDTRRGEVIFSFNAKETHFLQEIDDVVWQYLGVKATVKKSISKRNSLYVRVKCKPLALFLERTFGHHAHAKRIPWEWLRLPSELLKPLVRGIWYGDGSNKNTNDDSRFTYATTSIDLADFMELAFLKLRIPYRRLVSRERTDSKGVHHRKSYYLFGVDKSIMSKLLPRLEVPQVSQVHRTSWFEGDKFVFPIKETQVARYQGSVYNLEVEGSNSYVVEGATLHNCLPKDSRSLAAMLKSKGFEDDIISNAIRVNDGQVSETIRLAERLCGSMDGRRVSVLGLAFKAGTDDVRDSVAISLIRTLIRMGAEISAYDPVAMENAKNLFGSQVSFTKTAKDCIRKSECAFLATGWDVFKELRASDFKRLMAIPVVVDGRRIFDQAEFRKAGVTIATIGTYMPVEEATGKFLEPGKDEDRKKKVWHYTFKGVVAQPTGQQV